MKRLGVLLALLILAACQSSPSSPSTDPSDPTNPVAPTLTLTPAAINVNAGAAPVTFVATVQNSTETVTWIYSGAGSVTPASGPATSYTPPASVTDVQSESLTAVLGTTGVSATAVIPVYPSDETPPPDPTDASDPSDPTDASDPTDPTNPDPTNPDPTNPDPTNPDPTDPTTSYTLSALPPTNGVLRMEDGGDGIDCGVEATDCTAVYAAGAEVTLIAIPIDNWEIDSWGDDCSGNEVNLACTLTMDADKTVSVTFKQTDAPIAHVLRINIESVYGVVNGQDDTGYTFQCYPGDSPCQITFDVGAAVTLTAPSGALAQFENWEGDCSGSDTCSLTMDTDREVTAVFFDNPPQ